MIEIDTEIDYLMYERDRLRTRMKEIATRLHVLRMRRRRAKAEVASSFDEIFSNLEK